MQTRDETLKAWLAQILGQDLRLFPLAGDASFRRYFRLQTRDMTYVVMDAPPEKEALAPFIEMAALLTAQGLHTPELIAINQQEGFLLLSDFGDQLLLNELNAKTADGYYQEAIKLLFSMQKTNQSVLKLPVFDKVFMLKEMHLCVEWFFTAYLGLNLTETEHTLIQETMQQIAEEVSCQPLVLIHRDYHSRNLMCLDESISPMRKASPENLNSASPHLVSGEKEVKEKAFCEQPRLGVLDFQDAMLGPFSYDLVSLLKDCYIAWPREKVLQWAESFYKAANQAAAYNLPEFIRAFDLCGLQRHLKILGIFCRLHLRDKKENYLRDLPLTLRYVLECTEIYPSLNPFFDFLQNRVQLP